MPVTVDLCKTVFIYCMQSPWVKHSLMTSPLTIYLVSLTPDDPGGGLVFHKHILLNTILLLLKNVLKEDTRVGFLTLSSNVRMTQGRRSMFDFICKTELTKVSKGVCTWRLFASV